MSELATWIATDHHATGLGPHNVLLARVGHVPFHCVSPTIFNVKSAHFTLVVVVVAVGFC